MAKSVFSLDPNTTKAEEMESDENSFDGESIETTGSLNQEEIIKRAAKEDKINQNKKQQIRRPVSHASQGKSI